MKWSMSIYVGDTLIATKIISEQNVLKGEINFKSDLSFSTPNREILVPIKLTEIAAAQWGQKSMPRFLAKSSIRCALDDGLEDTKCTFQVSIMNDYHKLHPPISEVRAEKKVSRNDEVDELNNLMDGFIICRT